MKRLFCFAATILLAASVVSCKSENSNEFKPSLDTETRCSIKVVGDYDNFEALEDAFVRFNKYYPNVSLSYKKPDNYEKTLAGSLEREDGPNIFFSSASWIKKDSKQDIVSHMEDLSDPKLKLNLDCLRPGLINHDANNRVLLFPIFSRTYGTLVNNDLFKKENISVPNTWSELLSASQAFKDKGYKSPMMGYTLKDSSCLMNTVAYPSFVVTLANNPEALQLANALNPAAGEYMRESLEIVKELKDKGITDLDECDKITDNYSQVLLRFFEGDVPMMICAGDTVSGRKKREAASEAFTKSPFKYTYIPIPLTEQGGYFIDSPSRQFSVNKDCQNLDMTNEFMRFLIRDSELKTLASAKGLINSTRNAPFDEVYSPFANMPEERTFSPEVIGITDDLAKQIRVAAYKVGRGDLTIDEAVAQYGSF